MRPGWGFDPPPGLEARRQRQELLFAQMKAKKAVNALQVISEGTHPDPRDLARRVLTEIAQDENGQ